MATNDSGILSASAARPGPVPRSSGPPPLPSRSKAAPAPSTAPTPAPSPEPIPELASSPAPAPPASAPPSPPVKAPRRQIEKIEVEGEEGSAAVQHSTLRSGVAFLVSMVTHAVLLIALALWVMPETKHTFLAPLVVHEVEELPEELNTVILDERLDPATSLEVADSSSAAAGEAIRVSKPEMDRGVLEQDAAIREFGIEDPLAYKLTRGEMVSQVPDGTLGDARNIADNYQQAIDQITQEILLLLTEQKVLVIWCFDQSGSMKDDQKEIRDRLERVYAELGLSNAAAGDALATAVTSYGEKFACHTERPTTKLDVIRKAIDSVPVDDSGKEMMCEAVGRAIAQHRSYGTKGQRRMVLVLVTDESGEPENNAQYLEQAIQEAKAARCIVYVLGREAVFGYPYAHIVWVHPQTGRPHWIQIDRGPETAFPEQIQTDGFQRRYDAHSSGFGPYALSRLAHQTGGTFFMLPSVEKNLVWGEKRRYELEAMRAYRPDLRSQLDIFTERDRSKLRTMLWGIISDLNPYNPKSAQVIEMRVHFSPKFDEFVRQVPQEHQKAKIYMAYLDKAIDLLEKNKRLRQEEASHRWQGNYDLMIGQLVAYRARMIEYCVYLDAFVKTPKRAPLTKLVNTTPVYLIHWDITTRAKTLTGKQLEPLTTKADALFNEVIKNHPGTPWAARAQWELSRGYGIDLVPYYEPKYKDVKDAIPVPKL